MSLQRIRKTFLNRDTGAPYVGFPVTVHRGLSLGSPLRLYSNETGTSLLSSSGTILTDGTGTIDVWVEDSPYYQLILRTVDRRTIIDRVQTFGYGKVDNQGLDNLSVAEIAALRGFISGGSGSSPVLSVAGRTGLVVLTADDVGLSNVNNTADMDKPASTAVQAALALKLDANLVSPYMLTVLNDVDSPAARISLGLGSAATADASTFAPTAHGHSLADVTGLSTALDGKQAGLLLQDEGSSLGAAGTVTTINFTGPSVQATRVGNVVTVDVTAVGGGGVTDHGFLTGLGDDDHIQYFNAVRGDARYALVGHTHPLASSVTPGNMSAADKAKLDTIASGATANATDAALRDRATHTGFQDVSTITNLGEAIDDRVATLLVAGSNVTLNYNDAAGTLTINAAAGSSGATNLAAVAGSSTVLITSDTGTDATIAAASGTNAGLLLPAEKTKLSGIATGATANSADATLLNRTNHTGTQASTTISDFAEAVDDRVATLLVAGTNITLNYNDVANTLTINAAGGGGGSGANLSVVAAPTQVTVLSDSGTDAVLAAADGTNAGLFLPAEKTKLSGIAAGATVNSSDAALRDRSTHTGTQFSTSISDFGEAVDDRVASMLVAGAGVTLDYNDVAGTLTLNATGGSGATNLSATLAPTQITINSDTGADVVVPATDGTNAGLFLPAEKTKLAGIAAGATANAADATLLERGNHTGTQLASTISDFGETVDDRVNNLLVAGSGVSKVYDDLTNQLTLSVTPVVSAPIIITGTLGEGNQLTATLSGGLATGFQWYRDTTPIGGATNIDGTGTISLYTQQAADIGTTVSVRAIGYTPLAVAGVVPASGADTRPRFGIGAANAWTVDPAALLASMLPVPSSVNDGRAGTFNLTTSSGNFGWVAVVASVTTGGLRFFDGVGFGGWSGAGLPGNNLGASPDPSESSITYNDGVTTWRLFRQDFINANPVSAPYTLS